jgi:hypothetical protein
VDIKLGTTFTLFQPGRKRLNPSYFLCVFRDTDANETRQAITQSIGDAVGPLLLELTEGTSDPLDGVVQLYSGDWVLTVYEQTSATNLDAANADRNVWTELVRVSAQCGEDPGPQPYDPCAGCEGGTCDLCTEIAKTSSTAQDIVDCIEDADKTAAVQALICVPCPPTTVNGTESDTPTITVLQGGQQVGTLNPETGVHAIECDDEIPDGIIVIGCGCPVSNGVYIKQNANTYETPSGSRTIIGANNGNFPLMRWSINTVTPFPIGFYRSVGEWASPQEVEEWELQDGPAPPPREVRDATVADLCKCFVTVPISVNGVLKESVIGIDPCEENTINITIE